jgi:hypothetical protein
MDGYRFFGQRSYTKVLDAEEVGSKWTVMDESVMDVHSVFFKFRVNCGRSSMCAPLSSTRPGDLESPGSCCELAPREAVRGL